jgi:hypothetical protein
VKPVVIPNPAADDCEEIAALKKMRDALTEAIKALEAKTNTSTKEPPAGKQR